MFHCKGATKFCATRHVFHAPVYIQISTSLFTNLLLVFLVLVVIVKTIVGSLLNPKNQSSSISASANFKCLFYIGLMQFFLDVIARQLLKNKR